MTVAPLIAMKSSQVKSFDAVGRELDRRAHTYANDVDQSGRHIGYRCRAEDERPVPLEKAVGRLEVAIADLARRLGPRSARMTTRALKRDLAALERDYGEDDDRSPKARAAEAQRAARARDANRDDRPPQRSWSQSR